MIADNGESLRENAILEQLKRYLSILNEKFGLYLRVLDEERNDVASDEIEKLARHAEIERSIMKEIGAIQKVVDPLEEMYKEAFPSGVEGVENLRETLEGLRLKTALKINANQELLAKELEVLKKSMEATRKNRRSVTAFNRQPDPAYIDIQS